MPNPKNVQIPYDIFLDLLQFMEDLDINEYDEVFKVKYFKIKLALDEKKKALESREAYSKLVNAKNDTDREIKRIEYLAKKNKTEL